MPPASWCDLRLSYLRYHPSEARDEIRVLNYPCNISSRFISMLLFATFKYFLFVLPREDLGPRVRMHKLVFVITSMGNIDH